MRRALVLAALLAVAGCATPQVSGNAQGGVMDGPARADRVFNAAEAHCTKYGKQARITQVGAYEAGTISFACV